MAKKYTDNRRGKKSNNNELMGIVLICVSAFFLLCIIVPIILGAISEAIRGVVLGVFGLFSYPMFLAFLLLGIALWRDLHWEISLKNKVCIAVMAFCAVMILQLATSYAYLGGEFTAYISAVFDSKLTAGGVLFGVLAYGLQAAVTQVFAYILLSTGIIVSLLVMLDVFKKLRGTKRGESDDAQGNLSANVKPAQRMIKPVTGDKPAYYTIVRNGNAPVRTMGGSFSTLTEDEERESDRESLYEREYEALPEKREKFQSYADVKRGYDELLGTNKKTQFAGYNDDKPQPSAHDVLFGGKPTQYTGFSSGSSGSSFTPNLNGGGRYVSPFDSFGTSSASRASESDGVTTPTPAVSEPQVIKAPPPMFYHTEDPARSLPEVAMPVQKEVTYIEGTILDGEAESRKIAEASSAESDKPAYETRYDFDNKKAAPATFRPIEKPKEEPPKQSPIINGDYFGKKEPARPAEEARPEPNVTFTSAIRPPVQTPVYERPEPEKKAETFHTFDIEDDNAFEEEELAPIINGANNKPLTLEELIADDKKIMNRESAPTFEEPEPEAFDEPEEDLLEDEPEQEKIPPIMNGTTFKYIDETEDLSEKTFAPDEDNTGYYETTGDIGGKIEEKKEPTKIELPPMPKLKPQNQLRIEDVMKDITPDPAPKPKKKKHVRYDPPPIDLLTCKSTDPTIYSGDSQENARILEKTLESLKFPAKVTGITSGPAVTRYELEVPPGNSVRKIDSFADDIAYNLASNSSIRIETPIPGKRAVGIEVPNREIATVALHDLIECKEFQSATSPVALAIGKDIAGANIVCNLEKMPHLLIAGATGSGKSACLNSIIVSILYKASPDDVRLILIDPKEVEFRIYQDMPHLLIKNIISETDQAIRAFKWAKTEMDRRYKLLSKYCVRNIQEFNNSPCVKDGVEEKLPRIVVIVDELCELMLSANRKDLEDKIMSMAQKARAAGVHLILATQRPSVDVITGTIKANLPSRIAFAVTSFNDSRTILDQGGAESLLGRGDMLYAPADMPQPKRVQGAYITTEEVTSVVEYVKEHNQVDYDEAVEELIMTEETPPSDTSAGGEEDDDEFDPLIKDVLRRVIETGMASTSMIQRRFSVGYARASRIIDQMEMHKFIGPLEASNKPREVFITSEQFRETFGEDL